MTIELTAPRARALVEPTYGGRLHQLFVDVDGKEEALLLAPADLAAYESDPTFGGCFPMAPWPNRIAGGIFAWRGGSVSVENGREHALHGLVLDRPWDVVARVGRVVEMTCDFGDRWPWAGKAWQRIELGPNCLAFKMEVRSAREMFPAGCGWHPWFRRDVADSGSVAIETNAERRYVLKHGLPTGEVVPPGGTALLDGSPIGARLLDDCYTGFDGPPLVTLAWERLALRISFECPTPHLQVYTPPEAVCIEPQTCAPDAFTLAAAGRPDVGMAVVSPGLALSMSMRWTWEAR